MVAECAAPLAMWGWSISASARRSVSKRTTTSFVSIPQLDDLERDVALHRLALMCPPDRAHAALADLLDQLVAVDLVPRALARRGWGGGDRLGILGRARHAVQRTGGQQYGLMFVSSSESWIGAKVRHGPGLESGPGQGDRPFVRMSKNTLIR